MMTTTVNWLEEKRTVEGMRFVCTTSEKLEANGSVLEKWQVFGPNAFLGTLMFQTHLSGDFEVYINNEDVDKLKGFIDISGNVKTYDVVRNINEKISAWENGAEEDLSKAAEDLMSALRSIEDLIHKISDGDEHRKRLLEHYSIYDNRDKE